MPLVLNCLFCLQMLPFHVSSKVLCVVLGFALPFCLQVWFQIQWDLWSYRRAGYTLQTVPPEAVNSLLLWNKLCSTKWQITAVQRYSSACDSSSWGILLHSSNRSCSFAGISLMNYHRWYDQAVTPGSCWAWDHIATEIFFSTWSTDYIWNKSKTTWRYSNEAIFLNRIGYNG